MTTGVQERTRSRMPCELGDITNNLQRQAGKEMLVSSPDTASGVAATAGSGAVNDDVEALAKAWNSEIAREQVVLSFAYLERVLATRISCPKPLLADHVRDIE